MGKNLTDALQEIDLPSGYSAECDDDGIIITSVDCGFCVMRWVVEKNDHVRNANVMLKYLER